VSLKAGIVSSCVISKGVVYKDGTAVFENKGGDVAAFLLSVYQHLGVKYSKFYKMDNLAKLGWLAAEVLLTAYDRKDKQPTDIGVVLTNASASLDADTRYYNTVQDMASPALFVYTLPNIVIGEICIRHQMKGENAFFVFDEFNGTFIQHYVNDMLDNGLAATCICGWVELLKDEYRAVLFLVEKDIAGNKTPFTIENIYKIYEQGNG
jgi:hypothetical protein